MGSRKTLSDLAPSPDVLLEKIRSRQALRRSPPAARTTVFRESVSRYGQAALASEIEALRQTPEGERNATLNKAAFCLGQLVGGGVLPRDVIEQELRDACMANGLIADDGVAKYRATLESGLSAGIKQPRRPEPSTCFRPSKRKGGGP